MAEKPNIIANRTHGFDETDVEKSDDLHKLRRWLILAQKDVDILKNKIKRDKAKESTGQEIDHSRHASMRTARDIQKKLCELIKNRINELMENSREWYQFELNFFEAARKAVDNEELGGEIFDVLVKRAQGYEEV